MQKPSRAQLRDLRSDIGYCECGKPVYDKKGAVTVVNFRWDTDHVKLRAHPCDLGCNGWHVTKDARERYGKKRKY